MKTNNRISPEEKKELKARHRLECVMQESGERFEADSKRPNLWRSLNTPGLVVDVDRQTFKITSGRDTIESGDVIAWLIYRNGWTFPQALRFLQKRRPDPKRVETPRPAKAEALQNAVDEDEPKPLDRWQEKALEIAGERIREYFSWTWYSLLTYLEETRIEPTHAPGETICPRCEERIDWQMEKVEIQVEHGYRLKHVGPIPVIAYSIKHRLKAEDFGVESDELIEALRGVFVEEEDGVICQACAWREYDFQIALELVKKSAWKRSEEESEKQRKRDREAWLEADAEREREQERQEREADHAWGSEQENLQRDAAPPA